MTSLAITYLILTMVVCSAEQSTTNKACQALEDAMKFDCFPQGQEDQAECERRGCCWHTSREPQQSTSESLPVCFYPKGFASYKVTSIKNKPRGAELRLTKLRSSPYPRDVQSVRVHFQYVSKSVLSIKILDANHKRWEPPLYKNGELGNLTKYQCTEDCLADCGESDFALKLPSVGDPFRFKVTRKSGEMLMETTGGFIFSDQFLQLSSLLPSTILYGLGEHRQGLMVNTSQWSKITMWNRDHPPKEQMNLYGSHPVYVCKDAGGWHGVFLHNSNAMDVVVQPAPAITWRPIGGILHFYVMAGSSPDYVIARYTALIGRSFLPPYWGLGFHLCRQKYGTARNTLATVDRMRKLGIPQDVQWNDIDYAKKKRVFTTDYKRFGNQSELARQIHHRGLHYVIIVDCGISNSAPPGGYPPYDLGKDMGVFINSSDGKPLVGKVWPGTTVWPDFVSTNQTQRYWTKIAGDFHAKVPFDGMWLDMNEISNWVNGSIHGCNKTSRYDFPHYLPGVVGGSMFDHTICPSALHGKNRNYDVHNLYGLAESAVSFRTLKQIRRRRPFIISRSTFPGQGQYGGHWSGDNAATFYDMYKSISVMLHFNMYGIPLTGSDICGFHGNTTSELCTRWHQLGAFYVFSRNHNAEDCLPQDPGQFDAASVSSTRKALLLRYSLLPFLYTLMWRSHIFGETVARPLFFVFPEDKSTYNVDAQFMWGSALLISPVLVQGVREVDAYFPSGVWYDLHTGTKVINTRHGEKLKLPAGLYHINLHVRGGQILPMQQPALTTTLSCKNPFWLLVCLNETHQATGELYRDDGDSLDTYENGAYNWILFVATKNGISSTLKHLGYLDHPMALTNVTVLGLTSPPSHVTLDGRNVEFSFTNTVLYIINLPVFLTREFEIAWS